MRRRAVVVGVDHYEYAEFAALKYAEADALQVRDFLRGLKGPLAFERVRWLKDKSDHEILREIRECVRDLGTGDLFLFYFAGHGIQQHAGGQHLLLCKDAMPDVIETGNSNGTVPHKMLDVLTSGPFDRVLIFDACRNTYLTREHRRRAAAPGREMLGSQAFREIGRAGAGAPRTGRTVTLWSCNDGERAAEDEDLQGGVFTHALLQRLTEALELGRGALLNVEFMAHVRERMSELSGVLLDQLPAYSCVGGPIDLFAADVVGGQVAPRSTHRAAEWKSMVADEPISDPAVGNIDLDGNAVEGSARRVVGVLNALAWALFAVAVLLFLAAILEANGVPLLRYFWPDIGIDVP